MLLFYKGVDLLNTIKNLFSKSVIEKITTLLFIIAVMFYFKSMINILLLTFVFSFLLYTLQNYIFINLRRILPVDRNYVVAFVYVVVVLVTVFILYKYVPVLISQLNIIVRQVADFDINNYKGKLDDRMIQAIKDIDIAKYIQTGSDTILKTITNIGKWGLNILFSFVLSLFFVLEKDEIAKFGKKVENSKVSVQYEYIKIYGRSFLNSFSKVMETQLLISAVNSFLSVIALYFFGFHQVIGLGFMIFIFGLIPVAGVLISMIPLSIIGFKLGGVRIVLYVAVMVAFLHALEGYILNPKLMSINTKLPVFFTFLILLGSEHVMGIWGLLFGIPIFMFVLDILGIKEL